MKKLNSTDQQNNFNSLEKMQKKKLKNEKSSLFIYDENTNILNLTAQLPHSFALERLY